MVIAVLAFGDCNLLSSDSDSLLNMFQVGNGTCVFWKEQDHGAGIQAPMLAKFAVIEKR